MQSVLDVLAVDERSRNDDKHLTCMIWKYLYPSKVIKVYNHEVDKEIDYVSLRDIRDVFTYSESIRRARQIIQNDLGLYPPTNTKVKNKRKISEEIINNWFSNPLTKREQKEVYKLSNSIVSIYWNSKDRQKMLVRDFWGNNWK